MAYVHQTPDLPAVTANLLYLLSLPAQLLVLLIHLAAQTKACGVTSDSFFCVLQPLRSLCMCVVCSM